MKCMGETRTHDVRWLFFWLVYSGAAQLRSRFPSTVSYLNQLFHLKKMLRKLKLSFVQDHHVSIQWDPLMEPGAVQYSA